jgi:hypothetical protein
MRFLHWQDADPTAEALAAPHPEETAGRFVGRATPRAAGAYFVARLELLIGLQREALL